MGCNFLARSFSVFEEMGGNIPKPVAPNPDPNDYRVLAYRQVSGHLLLMIRYPQCTNYEGKKILLFKNTNIDKVLGQRTIDPHFSDNVKMYSPFARFEPTQSGWDAAIFLAKNL